MHILLVDPDQAHSHTLVDHLEHKGYEIERTVSVPEAQVAFSRRRPDLVLFDPLMPNCDDRTVLRWIRQHDVEVPVLIVSSLNDAEAAARCLLAGADDYIRKPFQLVEFDARLEAILRRAKSPAHEITIVGHLQIDDRMKCVTIDGVAINLSPKEYQLLHLCASDPGRVFSHDEIVDRLWPDRRNNPGTNDIKQYVHLLRSKLGQSPEGRQMIENVKGFGYRLSVPTIPDVGRHDAMGNA